MDIKLISDKIIEFDKKAGWDKTSFSQLMQFIQEEINNLKETNPADIDRINHLLIDIFVLLMQISYRYNTNIETEFKKWLNEQEQNLK